MQICQVLQIAQYIHILNIRACQHYKFQIMQFRQRLHIRYHSIFYLGPASSFLYSAYITADRKPEHHPRSSAIFRRGPTPSLSHNFRHKYSPIPMARSWSRPLLPVNPFSKIRESSSPRIPTPLSSTVRYAVLLPLRPDQKDRLLTAVLYTVQDHLVYDKSDPFPIRIDRIGTIHLRTHAVSDQQKTILFQNVLDNLLQTGLTDDNIPVESVFQSKRRRQQFSQKITLIRLIQDLPGLLKIPFPAKIYDCQPHA